MRTAGLNVKRLAGFLERLKVNCVVIEEDEVADHCVLLLSSRRRPGLTAQLEYENKGFEPRIATLKVFPSTAEEVDNDRQASEKVIQLTGPRSADVNTIIQLVADFFLNQRKANV